VTTSHEHDAESQAHRGEASAGAEGPLVRGVTLEIAALPRNIRRVRRLLTRMAVEHGADAATEADIARATSEAVANAIVHGTGGRAGARVRVTADIAGGALEVVVSDDGDADGVTRGPPSPGLGLGLEFIATSTAAVRIARRQPSGTDVWMRFDLQ
jgi:anti-sigma regulatory factor (Ser/Thr protein kinase)